jgi:hypothetical protein
MTIKELTNVLMGVDGAVMGRVKNSNFVIVPLEDGSYAKVNVSKALMEDTKTHAAFNYETAVADYKAWEAAAAMREAEKASKPKTPKGPSPEAQARRDELDAMITNLPAFTEYTATDIRAALADKLPSNVLVMQVGQSARRLVEKGVLTVATHEGDKKPYYTKA